MFKKIVFLLFYLNLIACTSSSEIAKRGYQHEKNSKYYEDIGHKNVSDEELRLAEEDFKDAEKGDHLLAEFLRLFLKKNSN